MICKVMEAICQSVGGLDVHQETSSAMRLAAQNSTPNKVLHPTHQPPLCCKTMAAKIRSPQVICPAGFFLREIEFGYGFFFAGPLLFDPASDLGTTRALLPCSKAPMTVLASATRGSLSGALSANF